MMTSYFAKYKEPNGISIALFKPKWFKGDSYPDLFPNKELLNKYKAGLSEQEYVKIYMAQLNKLNPNKVYTDLQNKVLLCYEKSGEFCHRRIISDWLKNNLNVDIPEYD